MQVLEVPKISQDSIPQRRLLSEPQLVQQLVEAVLEGVILARGRSALGLGTRNTRMDVPQGFTASPGRFSNTGRRTEAFTDPGADRGRGDARG